jgi:hypothetical protein
MSLGAVSYASGGLRFEGRHHRESQDRLPAYLETARALLGSTSGGSGPEATLPEAAERLRWFLLPADALAG